MSRCVVIVIIVLIGLVVDSAQGKVICVDANAPGANDGTSWENAYNSLQDALADANSSEKPVEIRVAPGVYTPDSNSAVPNGTGDREATFQLSNGVTMNGGYAGFGKPYPNVRDIEVYETILSGDLRSNDKDVNDPYDLFYDPCRAENSYHVVTGNGTDKTAILDGFTITAGNADGGYSDRTGCGGGMLNDSGSSMVTRCTLIGNSANCSGGGIFIEEESNLTIRHCTITYNGSCWSGGGINFDGDSMMISDCTITGNFATIGGGGIYCESGGSMITNCVIRGNRTEAIGQGGGGIHGSYSNDEVIYNCRIIDNHTGTRRWWD